MKYEGSSVVESIPRLTMAPKICGSSVWNLLLVTLLALRILRWLLEFWKICTPLLLTTY